MNTLSIETGFLFDLSLGNVSISDMNTLKQWAEYISNNPGVQDLCDMLGRIRAIEQSTKQEIVKSYKSFNKTSKDFNSKEEIVGIRFGNDLEYALPQELALLGDEDTSILFDRKLIESELMCFQLEGNKTQTLSKEEDIIQSVIEEEGLGPIIICVDTSGSMRGSPETIAKAIALYMASRAKSQRRNCLLINFSTSIETLDLSKKIGMKQLIEFLCRSFSGGTDVAPAINYAAKMIQDEDYCKADILIISDFIMNSLPSESIDRIKNIREKSNKLHAVTIGDMFVTERLKGIFDNEWIYNPDNSNITQLKNITDNIATTR